MSCNDQVYIYFLIDKEEIVYIGVSQNVEQRLVGHKDKQYTKYLKVKAGERKYAVEIERQLIISHRPKYNTVHLFAWFGSNWDELRPINKSV